MDRINKGIGSKIDIRVRDDIKVLVVVRSKVISLLYFLLDLADY